MFPVHVLHANPFFISTSKIMKSSFIVKIYKSTIKAEEFLCNFFFYERQFEHLGIHDCSGEYILSCSLSFWHLASRSMDKS
jgi:hypothetical protein